MTVVRRYPVLLTDEERAQLQAFLTKGTAPGRKYLRARILLMVDETAAPDEAIAAVLRTSKATVERTRKKFAAGGIAEALAEKPRTGAPHRLSAEVEQVVVALASDAPPAGHSAWTMQLLADCLVEFGLVDAVSDETVRRVLKKMSASPG